jgi:hypothetical protein
LNLNPKTMLMLLLAAGANANPCAAEPLSINIDAGGVEVELVDAPLEPPLQLTYRAQGNCQPEVSIVTNGNVTTAVHTKSCHGSGDHEGTVFTLRVNAQTSFKLALNAGGVQIGASGLESYRQIRLVVKVGGIGTPPEGAQLVRHRKWLVGAEASAERNSGCCTMSVRVNYGGISFH